MKNILSIIADIQESYPLAGACENGACELCGYDTSLVNNCSINPTQYQDKTLKICTRCLNVARKKWIGEDGRDGPITNIQTFFIPRDSVLDRLPDHKMAQFLTERLQKRLKGFAAQKQMVPA